MFRPESQDGFDAVDAAAYEAGMADAPYQGLSESDLDAMFADECDDHQDYEDHMTDAEADADTFRSVGWGTDEDYGYFGGEDYYGLDD